MYPIAIFSVLIMAVSAESGSSKMAIYESKYYTLETNVSVDRAKFIGKVMDAAGKEYDRRFQSFSGKIKSKPKLKIFATREEYVAGMNKVLMGGSAEFTGGLFYPLDGYVYSFESKELEATLKHECFHQFVNTVVGGRLPTWTNEGLAEYFEDGVFDEKSGHMQIGAVHPRRVEWLRAAKEAKALFTVEEMLEIGGQDWHSNMGTARGPLQYAQAWALCHFLIHGDGGKYQDEFDAFLRHIDRGLDGDSAFKRVFGADRKGLQKRYGAYVDELISKLPAEKEEEAEEEKEEKQGK